MKTRRRGSERWLQPPAQAGCRPAAPSAFALAPVARLLALSLAIAMAVLAARGAPVISEFMASNRQTLADSDGAFADWIEIHNPDTTPVDLAGWHLTDNVGRKTKWQFPAVTLAPAGYLVVFASEKDRRDPSGPLHTNFALSADGEYLGLIAPDGVTVASEFAPAFPAQVADVAYGLVPETAGTAGFLSVPTPGQPNAPRRRPSVPLDGGLVFSGELPILVLDQGTNGPLSQADGEKPASLQLFEAEVATFSAPIGLKVRGSSSADFPKKSFSIELHTASGANRPASLLGLAAASDWALVSPWMYDPSYARNAFMYALSNRIGRWAPRTSFVEMFVKEDTSPLGPQHYAGIGVLTERIEINAGRLNIQPIAGADAEGEPLTGGYILKTDPKDPDEIGWTTTRGLPDPGENPSLMLIVVAPNADRITPVQRDYIRDYVQGFEDALYADRDSGWASRRYLDFIDRASWVDYHLLQVLAKNPDGLERSTYFHKDRGGKLKAGPVWDFDRALGSTDPRSERWDEWFEPTDSARLWETGWWGLLAQDPDFMQAWIDRWQAHRRGPLADSAVAALMHSLGQQIDPAAAARDASQWSDNQSRFGTHRGEMEHLANWVLNRAAWIDAQFVPAPEVLADESGRFVVPPAGALVAYALDGTDPRAEGGAVAAGAVVVSGTLRIPEGATATVRIYKPDTASADHVGSPWSSAVVSAPGSVSPAASGSAHLTAISSRVRLSGPGATASVGVIVAGPAPGNFVVRAVGPTLGAVGGSVLPDPVVRILSSDGGELGRNADWRTGPAAASLPDAFQAAGAFPLAADARDAALLVSLAPGGYTIEASSATGESGAVWTEIHAADSGSAVSCLSAAATLAGGEGFASGFVLTGEAPRRVLVLGRASAGATGEPAADPMIAVFASERQLAASDDWDPTLIGAAIATAASVAGTDDLNPTNRDAAVVLTLNPGVYTVQAEAKAGAGGRVLVAVIELP